jgi:hypothetical protein
MASKAEGNVKTVWVSKDGRAQPGVWVKAAAAGGSGLGVPLPRPPRGRGGRGGRGSSRGGRGRGAARGGGGGGGGAARGGSAAAAAAPPAEGAAAASKKRPRAEGAPAPTLGDPDRDALHLTRLSDLRRAKVYAYKGVGAFLDVREMYKTDKLPFLLPGKKGITLTLPQVEALLAQGDAILAAMRAVPVGKSDEEGAGAAAEAGKGEGGGAGEDAEEAEEEEEEEEE